MRVLAATNRDLREEVNKGSFRLDLYYRLAVVMLRLPPLRDRMDDLPRLLDHFLREGGHEGARTEVVSDAVMQQLMCHRWPGNVRELRNWVEATLAMGEATELHGTAEPPSGESDVVGAVLGMPYKVARNHLLDIFEKRYVERIVAQCDGNVSRAARTARIDRTYLIRLLSKHGLR